MAVNRVWLAGVALAIVVGVAVSLGTSRDAQPAFFTSKVERGDVRDVVDSTGTINAVTTVLVGSQVSGRIATLKADFNSVVKKGQVIAEIDPALFRGALLQAEADLKSTEANLAVARAELDKAKAVLVQTKADYGRAATLATQDSIAMQQVDLSKANYESAIATVASDKAAIQQAEAQVKLKAAAVSIARTNLDYTVIRSPIDGTVVARNVDVGQTVAASLQAPTLFTIARDLAKMQVYAKIDESNVGRVKLGRMATFKVDSFPKETFRGIISQVRMNPTTIQNVVTYDAVIEFDNLELKLFPGMTAYVTIPVASAEGVLKIPNAALRFTPQLSKLKADEFNRRLGIETGPRTVVWKLHDGELEPARIELGVTDHSYTAVTGILKGELREGDDLITGAVPVKDRLAGEAGSLRKKQ